MTKCTNQHCEYGPNNKREQSYDSDPTRIKEGRQLFNGLCLNCIDDERKDREMMEDCAD